MSTDAPSARLSVTMAVAGVALGIDVASKVIGSALLTDGPVTVGPVTLRLVHNSGLAFGVGAAAPDWLILALTLTAVGMILTMAWQGAFRGAAAGLVIGGAVANVADRALDGSVVDLIDIGAWPTFNLADSFIVVGLGLLVLGERKRAAQTSAIS